MRLLVTSLRSVRVRDADTYRLTARGRKGVINMKTTNNVGKVVSVL